MGALSVVGGVAAATCVVFVLISAVRIAYRGGSGDRLTGALWVVAAAVALWWIWTRAAG